MKNNKTTWTHFWDMYSGGSQKEKFAHCFIEAPENEAKIIFYNRFGHNPERVTCTCCGEDYSISEEEDLAQATAYQRGWAYAYFKGDKRIPKEKAFIPGIGTPEGVIGKYIEEADIEYSFSKNYVPLDEYIKQDDVCIIYAKDIKDNERTGDVPSQGYVWVG